jgi:5'-3' exonuclease
MKTYVEVQSVINEKRMAEYNAQLQQQENLLKEQQQQQELATNAETPS